MTYEELLADIASKNYRESRTLETPYAALRAVAELHEPRKYRDSYWCTGCQADFTGSCPTLDAIKKELA